MPWNSRSNQGVRWERDRPLITVSVHVERVGSENKKTGLLSKHSFLNCKVDMFLIKGFPFNHFSNDEQLSVMYHL
jgi:hypothetical protein